MPVKRTVFGVFVKEYLGISVKWLSYNSGVSRYKITRLCNNKGENISLFEAHYIAKFLKVTLDELYLIIHRGEFPEWAIELKKSIPYQPDMAKKVYDQKQVPFLKYLLDKEKPELPTKLNGIEIGEYHNDGRL